MKLHSIGTGRHQAHHDDFVDTMPSVLPDLKSRPTEATRNASMNKTSGGGLSLDWRWVTVVVLCAAGFLVKHLIK
ncbi:MAG: hypothetical protein JOY60_15760 [Burkholderiaceae bacterium]|nr:hypothetical protein [Burkholderiaceae bacterium]